MWVVKSIYISAWLTTAFPFSYISRVQHRKPLDCVAAVLCVVRRRRRRVAFLSISILRRVRADITPNRAPERERGFLVCQHQHAHIYLSICPTCRLPTVCDRLFERARGRCCCVRHKIYSNGRSMLQLAAAAHGRPASILISRHAYVSIEVANTHLSVILPQVVTLFMSPACCHLFSFFLNHVRHRYAMIYSPPSTYLTPSRP